MNSRINIEVPTQPKQAQPKADEPFSPDAVQRAVIALEATTSEDYKRMADVLTAIHDTADDRGTRMKSYVEDAKNFYKEMKEIAGA